MIHNFKELFFDLLFKNKSSFEELETTIKPNRLRGFNVTIEDQLKTLNITVLSILKVFR